ncbi:MAG: anthranilate phosphoribosyltransferase, partial [Acidobacteria bacterium]|nr:anthranilate phosphoribosyltransferase [Acidobacteriota bacterium]
MIALERLEAGQILSQDEVFQLFSRVIQGLCDEQSILRLLLAFNKRPPQPQELAGAARALREAALPVPISTGQVADNCGTGGDGSHSLNISTAAAFIAAAAGVPMAKHGNRSVSSRSGSADVLEQLGIPLHLEPQRAASCLDQAGICFLFAPQYHSGIRHVMPARKALGVRTIFNILGPLVNPTCPNIQLMGVFDPSLIALIAGTLKELGCQRALVVHGGGLDELAVHGPSHAVLLKDGDLQEMEIQPESVGLDLFAKEELAGGTPKHNTE